MTVKAYVCTNNKHNEKRSERRKHCALAVVRRSQQIFDPPQTPLPGARDC